MKLKRFLVSTFLLCIMILSFSAALGSCGDNSVANGEDTVTVTDALNREVTVSKNTKRVAALTGSFADVWVLSGGELCAAAEDAWDDFELVIPDAVNIGGAHSPSVELLLSSEPELVLASASVASNVEMLDVLESSNITVIYFDVDNFEDYLEMLRVCTDITGREDLYEKNGADVQRQIENIKRAYADSGKRSSVLLLRASSSSLKAKGSHGTVLGEMLSDIGCVNIADSDKSLLDTLSVEAIIRENPCHIFVVAMGGDGEAAKRSVENLIEENPAWSTLDAIRYSRVHYMDKRLFNLKPNERWAEAYQVLYETLVNE